MFFNEMNNCVSLIIYNEFMNNKPAVTIMFFDKHIINETIHLYCNNKRKIL